MSITFLPHYTAADIQAVKDISVWAAATCRSTTALARLIGGNNGTLSMVLRGRYESSPNPILARLLHAAGQRLPNGWANLLPAPPNPDPVICVPTAQVCATNAQIQAARSAREPDASDPTLRAKIDRALAKHCSQSPLNQGDLLKRLGNTKALREMLDAMIAAREVMTATVICEGKPRTVLYPVGRVPSARPGPKDRRRGPAVIITPRSVHGGNLA